jgi:hypothetical protein
LNENKKYDVDLDAEIFYRAQIQDLIPGVLYTRNVHIGDASGEASKVI